MRVLFLFIFMAGMAKAERCLMEPGKRVYQFPQVHWRPTLSDDQEWIDHVAQSQYELAKFILRHPELAVFRESVDFDLDPQYFQYSQNSPLAKNVRNSFPAGLPASFTGMTNRQKSFLAENGAVLTLYYLEKIKFIH